jgi:pilus assembly protein CpaD
MLCMPKPTAVTNRAVPQRDRGMKDETMLRNRTKPGRRLKALLAGVMGLPLAACGADRVVTGSAFPNDYRERHPIVLTDAPQTLDVLPKGAFGGLDPRQRRDVAAFAIDYRRSGKGNMIAQVPTGVTQEISNRRALAAIRAALAGGGVPGGYLSVTTYRPDDPTIASPIRLSFLKLQAKVASQCGTWPDDLGVSNWKASVQNTPYWNFGCATQSNFAAQVADPVDLVRGREEGRIDTLKRMHAVDSLRQGKDPSTEYRSEAAKTSTAIGGK